MNVDELPPGEEGKVISASGAVEWSTPQEQIDRLAKYILDNESHEITEGGAIDVAIKIISGRPLPSEAIIMFCAWLTQRKESICLGADYDAANIVQLYEKFCEVNGWADPREGFELTIKKPE